MMIQSRTQELGPGATAANLRAAVSSAVVAGCVHAFGDRMRGIVLTGSLARGEATFVHDSAGWNALGDAEYFVVFEQRCALPGVAQTESVRQEAERTLMDEGIRCHIDLSLVHPAYLRRLQPHILAYELRKCGQVVWGDPGLLSLIPPFPASAIVLEDAWRLLSNRMVEYLAVAAGLLQPDRPLPPAAFYRTVKLYLDMATSFLLFAGEYAPTYADRAARLRGLAASPRPGLDLPFPLDAFADRVAFCTGFKLRGPGYREEDAAAFQGEQADVFWKDAVAYARRLWRWELRRLTGSAVDLTDREMMRVWMRRQSMVFRIRGWVRVFRDTGWRCSWYQWPRWALLACRASPRHWVYAAAAEIFFRLPALVSLADADGQDGLDPCLLSSWLPSPGLSSSLEVGPLWTRAAAAVVSNYHRFVAITTA
jgi:hypothetical protein